MRDFDLQGTALVTGASSGIGEAYARRLAERGCDVVLVARREERLQALADELMSRRSARAEVLPADLSTTDGIAKVAERIASLANLSLLVNNAGFGVVGRFHEVEIEKYQAMLSVHILATVRLTHAALPGMIARGRGAVVNVSSIAGLFPATGSVVYGPSKSFLIGFSEGLAAELAGTGVRIQALCPGFTRTGFHSTAEYAGVDVRAVIPKAAWLTADEVVTESLAALERNQVLCIRGRRYRWLVALSRLGPVYAVSRGFIRRLRQRYRTKAA